MVHPEFEIHLILSVFFKNSFKSSSFDDIRICFFNSIPAKIVPPL